MLGLGIAGSSVGASVVAKADAVAQSANIVATTLYTVPANAGGMYRFSAYIVLTQAATTSSTLAQATVLWTDIDTNTGQNSQASSTNTANIVGTLGTAIGSGGLAPNAPQIINAKAGTVIQYSTQGYASVGATAMQYAVHIKLEYLGA